MTNGLASQASILVVDDDATMLEYIKTSLTVGNLPEPVVLADSRQAMDIIRQNEFMVVVLDLVMPHIGGMELLAQIKQELPDVECIMLSGMDDIPAVVSTIRMGAFDYLVKSTDLDKLVLVVQRAMERYRLRQGLAVLTDRRPFKALANPEAFQEMVAEDETMARLFRLVEIAAPTDYNLILSGESGTGKEMLARIIHRLSLRSSGPFVAVNMAAISAGLFEAEFFGYVKGAFTGAVGGKEGFFSAARGGTLFLDEITELHPELQSKLLRVIQEKEYYPVGSNRLRELDNRLIVATNRDLRQSVTDESFRKDLFFRLNEFQLTIPPLRDRKNDILPLAYYFLTLHARKVGKVILQLADDLAQALLKYDFPGNVRELNNLIAAAVLVEDTETLTLSAVPDLAPARGSKAKLVDNYLLTMDEVEKAHILRVLESCGGNRTLTANVLGIGLSTLQRKLKAYLATSPPQSE